MKFLTALSIFSAVSFSHAAASVWRMHPNFDGEILHVVETPDYTYFTGRIMPVNDMYPDHHSLFRYDKGSEEIQSLSTDNLLSCNTVMTMAYCAERGYLTVVYTNYDIDLIYDSGKVVNIPDYRLASIAYPKTVNSINFSPETGRIYLATEFGYIVLNDSKHEIAESRIFGEPLLSVARVGDMLLALNGNRLLASPASQRVSSLADFETVGEYDRPYSLTSLGTDKALLLSFGGSPHSLRVLSVSGTDVIAGDSVKDIFYNVENNRNGVTVASDRLLYQFLPDGTFSTVTRPEEDRGLKASSYNLSEIWQAGQRTGIKSSRISADGIVLSRDYISPNAPAPFISTDMRRHPRAGLLVQNFGFDYNFQNISSGAFLLSGYKDGEWSNYAPAYTNPLQGEVITRPSGFAIDPDNPEYVYVSSVQNGFARINIYDGSDIIHFSKPSDVSNKLPGFVALVPDQTGDNAWSCRFSVPEFDSYGNLWMSYTDFDNQTPPRLHLLCWEAADRKETLSASELKAPRFIEVPGVMPTNIDRILPLTFKTRKDRLVYCTCSSVNSFVIIDTGGTPADASDDVVSIINSVYDQDGNAVEVKNVRCLWEDPLTGNIWVGHSGGVLYFNPDDFMGGTNRVTRVKVARNDGTNLADYLLNDVTVNKIIADGSGRKWFATGGAGLVCLSADNSVIEEEITSSTGGLPDDIVYCMGYIPESNSMIVSTAGGIAEYYLPASASSAAAYEVRAYPNPVRPDYIGYVTIDGLPSGALVKIVDASGNLVREFVSESGGEVKWDVTNHQFRRVGSGVYFVLASGMDPDEGFSSVAKILVVN